jgi:hypothetical protein
VIFRLVDLHNSAWRVTESQETDSIQSQKGICAISGAPIFVGDDLEADHADSLVTDGPDSLENLKISTPEASRRKSHRREITS